MTAVQRIISNEYREMLTDLHDVTPLWGTSGGAHRNKIIALIDSHEFTSVLDFGCGKGYLIEQLKAHYRETINITGYDPCVGMYAHNFYIGSELVTCTDVLEHIEPELLDNVLREIGLRATKMVYFAISLVEAKQILPDGRNAHLIIQSRAWWMNKLYEHFPLVFLSDDSTDKEAVFICEI